MIGLTSAFGEDGDPRVGAVAAELRSVAAGARTLTALRSLNLQSLDMILKEADASRDDLDGVLRAAIEALDDPLYRAAAHDLFPLPYTDAGWPKLAVRGKRAADRFGIGYDGFRRGAESRPSRMDEVVRHVAISLLSVLDEEQPERAASLLVADEGAPPWIEGSDGGSGGARERRQRRRTYVSAAAVVLVVVVGLLVVRGSRERAEQPVARTCDAEIGVLDDALQKEPGAERLTQRLRSAFEDAGGEPTVGCAAGRAYRWQSLVAQEVLLAGLPNGALLASPNGVDVHLNRGAWGSYHQLGGKDGDAAQTTGGLVVGIVEYGDGHVEIELSTGTVLVAERADAPYFWIPAAYVPWWRNHPELGLPTGNPMPSTQQDFQHGVATVRFGSGGDPVARLVERPEGELPTLESIRGRLLRQADATAWLIDAEGRRQWIPDGDTWNCLGGAERRLGRDLPGYAIATLPYAGQARCAH